MNKGKDSGKDRGKGGETYEGKDKARMARTKARMERTRKGQSG